MTDYIYPGTLIADPVTFQRAANASITVYDINDAGNTTPLPLKDTTGLPMPNPVKSTSDAFIPPMITQTEGRKLVGAGLTVIEYSHQGIKGEAVAAREAAETAAANAGAAAAAELEARIAAGEFVGAPGKDGSNVLPTDDAIEQAINTNGTKTKAALSATIATASPVKKQVQGGNFPKPVRGAQLTVVDSWPNDSGPFNRILWTENNGETLYGFSTDATLRKSPDRGATWTDKAYLNWAPFLTNAFLKTAAGTLLTISTSGTIRRSTDDGVTWTQTGTVQTGQTILGTQSWCIHPTTGHIYLGMYGGADQSAMNLYRSTDDGLTWPLFHAFPGPTSSDPDKIVHIHSVVPDPVAGRVIVSCGDSNAGTGLYWTNAAGTGIEPIVLNRMLPADQFDAPRSIGVIPFPDYLAWASDSTTNPWMFRMARSEIGKANPVVERIYRLNSTAWWTVRASNDGSRWVLSASQENASFQIDKLVHLYAVEDQGATIYEIGALAPVTDTSPASSLMPVGQAGIHGETFFMSSRTSGRDASWKFRLGYGGGNMVPWPARRPQTELFASQNSGNVVIPASGSVVFGVTRVPSQATVLRIFEIGVDTLTGAGIDARLDIRVRGSAYFHRAQSVSSIQTKHMEGGGAMYSYTLTAGDIIEFVLVNTTAAQITAVANLSYGWGR